MNVFDSNSTTHLLKIIPRYYPEGEVTLTLKNEESSEEIVLNITPTILNGYLYTNISRTFKDNSNYQVTIMKGDEVVYRGKLFVTNQADNTQDYKISKDIFTYG